MKAKATKNDARLQDNNVFIINDLKISTESSLREMILPGVIAF
jgi:hypothetical protein